MSTNNGVSLIMIGLMAVAVTGILMSILSEGSFAADGVPTAAVAATVTPELVVTAATVVFTPVPDPQIELTPVTTVVAAMIVKAPDEVFMFDDAVPLADSPEVAADVMRSCFSAYSRQRNEAEGGCFGEWFPVDFAPRPGDVYWCADNGGVVQWVPVRFFDGRSHQTVVPYGRPKGCDD